MAAARAIRTGSGGQVQAGLDSAIRLAADAADGAIDMGANDIFKLTDICATAHPGDPAGIGACVAAMLPTFLANMESNLRHIFETLRAHFEGTIVALTYCALVYDKAGIAGTKQLNAR